MLRAELNPVLLQTTLTCTTSLESGPRRGLGPAQLSRARRLAREASKPRGDTEKQQPPGICLQQLGSELVSRAQVSRAQASRAQVSRAQASGAQASGAQPTGPSLQLGCGPALPEFLKEKVRDRGDKREAV